MTSKPIKSTGADWLVGGFFIGACSSAAQALSLHPARGSRSGRSGGGGGGGGAEAAERRAQVESALPRGQGRIYRSRGGGTSRGKSRDPKVTVNHHVTTPLLEALFSVSADAIAAEMMAVMAVMEKWRPTCQRVGDLNIFSSVAAPPPYQTNRKKGKKDRIPGSVLSIDPRRCP